MTKKAYGALLMNELFLMEDYGFYLPSRAFEEATGQAPSGEDFLQVMSNQSIAHNYKGKVGHRWQEFFWEGDLKPNTYLEVVIED
jgi:hypothetical protein